MKRNEAYRRRAARAVLLLGAATSWGCIKPEAGPQAPRGDGQASTYHTTDAAGAIVLRDAAGDALTATSTTPYSPRKTCGDGVTGCHDFSVVTAGYHFQQGSELVADSYNPQKPWLLSDGMYGKW